MVDVNDVHSAYERRFLWTISTGLSHSLMSSILRSWYLSFFFFFFFFFSCSVCSARESQGTATSMSDTLLVVLSTRVKSGQCAGITLSVLIL